MAAVKIKFNYKIISSKIKKKQLQWATKFLRKKIKNSQTQRNNNVEFILIDYFSQCPDKYKDKYIITDVKESFSINPTQKDFSKIIIYGYDTRGLIYAITEIVDRFENQTNKKINFKNIFYKTSEIPKTKIRSISKCFESDVEDLKWFYDKTMWREYLNMLISNRYNRFTFTLGMQYNYPYGNEFIKDVYFYLAYPFLVKPKGYKIYAEGINKKNRKKNLNMLKFISDEAKNRGLDFQLALWTQRYDFDDVPKANYQIKNVPKNYAEYCKDSLEIILDKCPSINGLTLRVHVECGIPERDYKFWETYFKPIKKLKREINLDLHAKGIDNRLINLALKATSNVTVSPKYIAEHMGLPYHQSSIRKQEMPPKKKVDKKWIYSEGKRKFLRYSYGDLLTKKRKYGILYRIWPGTQRILIWGDPDMARGYGKHSTFCNSLGVELCEPLSFKGRMGTGIKNGRFNYSKKELRTKYDWQKYIYTYKVWGKCVYNYKTKNESYERYFNKNFGSSSNYLVKSLSFASKILPFFTLVHGVSASNNSYWPEMYENMSIVNKAPHLPYSYDLHKPSRFGMSTSQDPNLIMSPIDLANCIFYKKNINKYSPMTMSNWFFEFAQNSEKYLKKAINKYKKKGEPKFKRLEIDLQILIGLGKFFSYKIKSSCYWELFRKTKKYSIGLASIKFYQKSFSEWKTISDVSKNYYLPDLTYGPQTWLRGRWDDRLPAIKEDIEIMKKKFKNTKFCNINNQNYEKILRQKLTQKFVIKHKTKITKKGLSISIHNFKISKNLKLYLNYREINQSKNWLRKKIKIEENSIFTTLSNKLLQSKYPIQYYFELVNNNFSSFCPGFVKNLSNQPYYTYEY